MSEVLIQDWSVVGNTSPYLPPECRSTKLVGRVYGHPRRSDGDKVQTTAIVAVSGRVVTTKSGTVYRLGRVESTYLKWLKDNGIKYDKRNPIVDRTKEKV